MNPQRVYCLLLILSMWICLGLLSSFFFFAIGQCTSSEQIIFSGQITSTGQNSPSKCSFFAIAAANSTTSCCQLTTCIGTIASTSSSATISINWSFWFWTSWLAQCQSGTFVRLHSTTINISNSQQPLQDQALVQPFKYNFLGQQIYFDALFQVQINHRSLELYNVTVVQWSNVWILSPFGCFNNLEEGFDWFQVVSHPSQTSRTHLSECLEYLQAVGPTKSKGIREQTNVCGYWDERSLACVSGDVWHDWQPWSLDWELQDVLLQLEVLAFSNATTSNCCNTVGDRPIIVIMLQYANYGKGKTIHSKGQMEHFGITVNDKGRAQGGKQCIVTTEGYVVPINIRDGLPYIDMEYPSDEHVVHYE